jgi:3'(2'), 5'-bisphosphate nucleotidase
MLEEVYKKKEDIFKIIKKAGNEILKVYSGNDFQVKMKSDQTPLTIADKKSNDVIVKSLKELFPEVPILSEESEKTPYNLRKKWKYLWMVDPLDGTKEFIKKNGEFSINLALIKNGKPVFGILYLPVLELFYYAGKRYGAYKIEKNGKAIGLKPEKDNKNDVDRIIKVIFSKSHYNQETREYVDRIKKQYCYTEMISVGSAMKLAYLAEGKADIYPRLAPTMEWDIAAGQIIVEETGGKVIDFLGKKPLIYNKDNLRNPWFLAFGNGIEYRLSSIES